MLVYLDHSWQEYRVDDVCSDVLYRPFLCAHTKLEPYCSGIPVSNAIPRLKSLSSPEFEKSWTDRPFILTGAVPQWPIYREWSSEALLQKYGQVKFRAEAVDWPLHDYVDYMEDNCDENPLYLFDRSFAEKMQIEEAKDGQYWAPECFGKDLFGLLEEQRPDNRWLIVGPERSGSTFHKDPNATSAWNAVLRGSKYWIMFPSNKGLSPPPGVYVSKDQSEVTSPLSIAEWLLNFHDEARNTKGCLEGICGQGEVLHVPSGWWHLVVNLESSIAITQNFVPNAHLESALDFLKHKADQVSGFKDNVADPYGLFCERIREHDPHLLTLMLEKMERKRKGGKRRWDEIVDDGSDGTDRRGFSFAFGDAATSDNDDEDA